MKTNTDWQALGFLEGIVDDKEKEYLSSILDYTLKLQNYNDILLLHRRASGVDVMYLPLIFRIAKEVYINENDLNNIYIDIRDNYIKKMNELKLEHKFLDLDYEMLFATTYTNDKINEYKNKLNENKD